MRRLSLPFISALNVRKESCMTEEFYFNDNKIHAIEFFEENFETTLKLYIDNITKLICLLYGV